jgi:uncharacterized protein (DUF1800 family)
MGRVESPRSGPLLLLMLGAIAGCSRSQSSQTPLDPDVVRFLEQATFGPTEALVAQVESQGIPAFLDSQLGLPPSSLGTFEPLVQGAAQVCPTPAPPNCNPSTCYRDNFTAYPASVAFFRNALTGEDQLRQRVAFALSQILVVSGDEVRTAYGIADYEQFLLNDAFANFRQILEDVTLSPAMGRYLDMVNNDKPNPAVGNSPNENYARELLQLFSIGLVKLNLDGTVVTDSTGEPVPTYDQSVVQGFAHVFTGWTYPTIPGRTQKAHNPPYYRGQMEAVASNHDSASKTLLDDVVLPAGQTPEQDLADALDLVFNHPNVGPFIGKQLIQFLVTSNPSPAYVARVAGVFNDNGQGVRGDLRAVVRAILLDTEARGATKPDPSYGKLREPVLLLTGLSRALEVASDGIYLRNASVALGQDVFQAPSVFNFYPPNYPLAGTSLVSPPSTLLDSATVMQRANVLYRLLFQGAAPDSTVPGSTGTQAPLTSLWALAGDSNALVDRMNALLMHGTMTTAMRQAVLDATNAVADSDRLGRARAAAYVVGTSAQYQVER